MHRRAPVLVTLLLLVALALAGPAGAPASDSPRPAAAAKAKKKCKKGFVRKKGRCVCPKGRTRKGSRCVTVKKKRPAATPAPTPGAPTPGAPTAPGPTDGPPFAPPGKDLTGSPAANAILPFLANSTFTDCVTGWPTCAVEERYGHFADATMFYCRLTSSSGSDIVNQGRAFQIIGADQKADGSWAATIQVASYDNQAVYYTWNVSTTGVANGLYWGPGASPQSDPPTQAVGPLQWVRGARNCSY